MQETVMLKAIDLALVCAVMFLIGLSSGVWLAIFFNRENNKRENKNVDK